MSRKEKTYIVKEDNRDKGKEFIITEMSAIKGQELASDIHREMMAVDFSGISPEVIAARFWMRDGFTPTDAISKRVVWPH